MQNKKLRWVLVGGLVLLMIIGVLLMGRQVTIVVDGQTYYVTTHGLTVSQALRGMGIKLTSADSVDPAANTWLTNVKQITVHRGRRIILWIDPAEARFDLDSPATTARQLLTGAGYTPSDQDTVKLNGAVIGLDDELPAGNNLLVQYTPAISVDLTLDGITQSYSSSAETIGKALWQNGLRLKGGDKLSIPLAAPLSGAAAVIGTSARPIKISVDGKTLETISAADSVGQALAQNDISLQNLDYSAPSEDSPLPDDGNITVVRVKLVVQEEQKVTPYTTIYTVDEKMAAGEKTVTREGQNGIVLQRVAVRYENDKEASRETLSQVVLQEKVDEAVTKGPSASGTSGSTTSTQGSTSGSVGTVDTPYGTLSYYYSTTVYATSYSPCRLGTSSCGYTTASGQPLADGVIAVTRAWYSILKGSTIYVPGYGIGTVLDTGGGVSGKQWIDLGYSDASWQQWSRNVTVYFLTPQPSGFSGSLP
jgi:uncharacterized protein YabE (DUF348 family)/3D (Asp-Asp-Asp) domain-containing protein